LYFFIFLGHAMLRVFPFIFPVKKYVCSSTMAIWHTNVLQCIYLVYFIFHSDGKVNNKMFIPNRDIHSYTSRQADLYHVPVGKKDTLLRYFIFRATKIFNNNMHNLDYNNNQKLFKKILRISLINRMS
jgi:hypothetical protein